MKLYLDDVRPAPKGWHKVETPEEVIAILKSDVVTVKELSLDHDLGLDDDRTGYTVLQWIEEQVFTANFHPPKIYIHTSNTSARVKMELALTAIINHARASNT